MKAVAGHIEYHPENGRSPWVVILAMDNENVVAAGTRLLKYVG
jgi:hypothetical protein